VRRKIRVLGKNVVKKEKEKKKRKKKSLGFGFDWIFGLN